ncbi:shikimate dehydrogenase, partial [Candidatus Roizmanbacteria bacterium CG10_big_fil_rev_8_21_14_0_10_39_12]
MNITGKTKLCIIIGDPVEHSLSPAMHNAAYVELG